MKFSVTIQPKLDDWKVIKEAEDLYPSSWIPEAISESVTNNKRNWNYISTVLESWKTRGKRDGKPTRNTGKTRYR